MSEPEAPTQRSERDETRVQSPDQLVLDSSHGFVRALRDPLNAIVLDADGLAAEAARVRASPGDRPGGSGTRSGVARARLERLQHQIEHVSGAIRMLERVLDRRPSAPARADLGRIVDEVGRFMAPYAARHGRRVRWVGTEYRTSVECVEQAVWQTLVVLVAERLLAIPRQSTLTLSVASGGRVVVEGDFAERRSEEAAAVEGAPARGGLSRLIENPWLERLGLSIDAADPERIVVSLSDPQRDDSSPDDSRPEDPQPDDPTREPASQADVSRRSPRDSDAAGCRASSS